MILKSFFRGLLFVVPVGLTVYLLYWMANKIDALPRQWFDLRPLPGLGIAFTVAAITAVGFLGSTVLTRWIVTLMDKMFQRAPGAKLIYGAVKDLMEAFVGEKKKFSKPVLVSLGDDSKAEILGFITREEAAWLGRKDHVAVYFPQSYNFAGNLALFPRDRVTPVDAEPSAVMQFIVSGGVSEVR
jgi:uncharacterized membrane protein